MNKWIELLLGLVLLVGVIILGTMVWPSLWASALVFLKGGIFWALIGIGLLLILLGISDLKN